MARSNASSGRSPQPPAVERQPSAPTKNKSKAKKNASYKSDGVDDHDVFLLPVSDYTVALGVTVLAAIVRIFRIYQPSSVVFDEVHFGGFASKYIKGRFFMDVHPPLAKMLIALTGWLAGFDGNFDFKDIGKDYLEPGVPYVAMRLFPAFCGIALAPFMFLTLKTVGCRTMTAAMGACLIIFENGLLTQARLILLDSPLVGATALTVLAFSCFTNQHEQGPAKAFQPAWWFWLVMTGLGLGVTLWVLLGDNRNVTLRLWAKHIAARAFCLIVIPITFYMAMFAIHFVCLVNPGDGDGFMSSEFQATLNSKGMKDVAADVVLGSRVTIRHVNTQGGYLHSHPLMYPTGSKQQQITLYPHKDENNVWLLENQTQPLGPNGPHYITDGTVLRLYHQPTHRRLHSHDVRPPVSEAEWQNEVSAYGFDGFDGDANDFFRVEIAKKRSVGTAAKERLRTIETKFRLVHIMSGCVLFSHKVKLPEWASEQQEVTCAKSGDNVEKVNYRDPGFFGKFWELQQVMWRTNAGLVESHAWDSRPESWPILHRGINFWGKHHTQIYLIGNPIVWWSSTMAIVVWVLFKGIAVLRWQRSYNDYSSNTFKRFDYEIGTYVLGWALHYFPFYLMHRQLFLHHYFPALYFAVIALCQMFDYLTARIPGVGARDSAAVNRIATSECNRVKLFNGWDWDCNNFFDTYAAYTAEDTPSSSLAATSTSPGAKKPAAPEAGEKVENAKEPGVSSSPPPPGPRVVAQEEKIEYRDQDGNLLGPEQVKELEGKIDFQTKYETRTRVLDENGVEIPMPEGGWPADMGAGVAPPHPDVQGVDKETANVDDAKPNHDAAASRDGEREAERAKAKPASESKDATGKDEL
ncbi:dolichyl-phosphate-mannose-protein mannosyltransferase domain-containing protein [Hirsutella rhossiliensis]|uniref:Dolichyl-phosphate-mannose--protein mannosyltransferase n=1 Tax=Hirsutella rhossiliensis TaxID=111463 RepID=A0A9P8MPG5_9HYPO|nr:dolichyl-phosphate-mannose-protein mannosyltransferase domain-containing protein [Hirsutella rhossiliensis]KAH0958885.1 dolichyl-phosphate-mannose-protein mannosyltransferase domain-containing protein [Hirsutella rhossiliensis]